MKCCEARSEDDKRTATELDRTQLLEVKQCERENVSMRVVIQRDWSKSVDQYTSMRICREAVTTAANGNVRTRVQ
jgi:hypothetical protein